MIKKNEENISTIRINSGVEGLDVMLKGGFIKGRNILVSGPAGSGKSTLAMQFAYHGAMRGEKSLYVTLEEAKEKIIEDMSKFNLDIKKAQRDGNLIILGGSMARVTSAMKKKDAKVYHIIREIEEVIKEKGIKRVVIDSLNVFSLLSEKERERRMALAALSNALSSIGCTTIFISETEEGSMKLSKYGIEEFIADGVIVLYLVRQGSRFVPGIAVRKMRGSDHDKEIRLFKITDKGMIVYPQETLFGKI